MNLDLQKISNSIPDALRPVLFLLGILVVVTGGYVAMGVQTVNAEGSCYTKTVTCHGFRVGENGNQCIGWERKKIDYVDKSSCQKISEIKNLCGRVKKAVCRREGTQEWMSEGTVFGRQCSTWNRVYDLGMTSCQQ